jgi:addiction module HigA family antidote
MKSLQMHNPPHPGELLKEDVLPALGVTISEAARLLDVSRVSLSRIVNGHAAISADMALRLGDWLGNGAEVWLRMQAAHDLWQAAQKPRPRIRPARLAA